MSTGDTFQKELIHNGYRLSVKSQGFVESYEIQKLVSTFEDDTDLRTFFVKQQFNKFISNILSNNKNGNKVFNTNNPHFQLFNFVQETRLIPFVIPETSTSAYYAHILNLSNIANQFFGDKISRSLAHICEKGVEIGVIVPDVFIEITNGTEFNNFSLLNGINDNSGIDNFHSMSSGKLCFYKITESLYEIWMKTENTGLLLEIWIYHILKEHFKLHNDIEIFHHVFVTTQDKKEKQKPNSVKALVKSNTSKCEIQDITEIDILIMKNGKPICIIECKNSKADMSDTLKLYGLTKLLNIKKGILVTNEFHRCKGIKKFKHICIVSDIITNLDFPNNFLKTVEKLVKDK